MDNFSFDKLKELIPKNLVHTSMNPDEEIPGPGKDERTASEVQGRRQSQHYAAIADQEPALHEQGAPRTYIDLLNECDNFPYHHIEPERYRAHISTYYKFVVRSLPDVELGYVLPSVVDVIRSLPGWQVDDRKRRLVLTAGSTEEERSKAVALLTAAMRQTDHFAVLRGWRDELYPVYGPGGELLLSIERAASCLFGVLSYGCHMTAYTRGGIDGKELKVWVPRRAKSKQTYGGMLDNTVAGGIATGEKPFESLVREAAEEASLPEQIVRDGAKAVGAVTYFHIRDKRAGGETRLLQPECQYVYDLELDAETVPKPSDDEVESFELLAVDAVKDALRDGEFKPNCALVMLDFFVRHGIITADDPGYVEICARLHRRLEFPTV